MAWVRHAPCYNRRMPAPGSIWRHVILSTYGSWLHGDPRGFRSREHRLHSSGDYKAPPPAGEHAGLHGYELARTAEKVSISREVRPCLGHALREAFEARSSRVLAMAVCATHVHVLAELPNDMDAAKRIVHACKGAASAGVRRLLPGRIWAAGGKLKPVRDREHQRRVYRYILDQQNDGWTWSFRDEG